MRYRCFYERISSCPKRQLDSALGKETEKGIVLLMGSTTKSMSEQKETIWACLWSYIPIFLQKAVHYAMPPATKRKKHRFPLVGLALLLILIGLCSPFVIESQIAWAANAHAAHPLSAALSRLISISSLKSRSEVKKPKNNKNKKNKKKTPTLSFPCMSATSKSNGETVANVDVTKDWLTGNRGGSKGHLMFTYAADTYALPEIRSLFGYMEGFSFLLITPSILLLGYQIMLGASVFRYVGALEGLSRVLLGALAVAVSFELVQMLISLENSLTAGIVLLHSEHHYPTTTIKGIRVPYTLPKQPRSSYAGIVVPMTRWGCAMNDFIGILSASFVQNTLASVIPFLDGFTHLTETVKTMFDLIERVGQMILTILSIMLWGQVFMRILFLNYYILTAPVAFGCWALPGGVGQNVVRLWSRGFLTVLFVQVVQLFILTTLPLILPPLPQIPSNNADMIRGFLVEFPPILTLGITVMAPRLVGASMAHILSAAGSMTGGAITAVGTAASRAM